MTTRASWITGITLLLGCIAFSGLSIPLVTVDDGLSELSSGESRAVAARALATADQLMEHPVRRLLFPAARIESVRVHPGHCGEPTRPARARDLVVTIRYYTFFSIPGPRVVSTCGGARASTTVSIPSPTSRG